jgi:hypothetical protein
MIREPCIFAVAFIVDSNCITVIVDRIGVTNSPVAAMIAARFIVLERDNVGSVKSEVQSIVSVSTTTLENDSVGVTIEPTAVIMESILSTTTIEGSTNTPVESIVVTSVTVGLEIKIKVGSSEEPEADMTSVRTILFPINNTGSTRVPVESITIGKADITLIGVVTPLDADATEEREIFSDVPSLK